MLSLPSLYKTYAALMTLLVITIAASYMSLGIYGIAVSLGIATLKALLVGLVFMGLTSSVAAVRLAASMAIFWLLIAVTITMSDYTTRGWGETSEHRLGDSIDRQSYDRVEAPIVRAHGLVD